VGGKGRKEETAEEHDQKGVLGEREGKEGKKEAEFLELQTAEGKKKKKGGRRKHVDNGSTLEGPVREKKGKIFRPVVSGRGRKRKKKAGSRDEGGGKAGGKKGGFPPPV